MYCKYCGKDTQGPADMCDECKVKSNTTEETIKVDPVINNEKMDPQAKSKLAAGLLGIFLGAFGVHNFYLGFTGKAVAQLLITILSCGILSIVSAIWGFIEGILLLTGSMNVDANGRALRD